MNSLTAYLVIGSVLTGIGMGSFFERCGTYQETNEVDIAAGVIAWPAYIVAALFYDFKTPPNKCEGELAW